MVWNIICPVCGNTFASSAPRQIYCSDKCRSHKYTADEEALQKAADASKKRVAESRVKASVPTERICKCCGKVFMPKAYWRRAICINCVLQERGRKEAEPEPTRRCHDCGKPTCDYRCEECQVKWKRKHGVSVFADHISDDRVM